MRKNSKRNARKLGYAGAGLAIGIISYLTLQVNIPQASPLLDGVETKSAEIIKEENMPEHLVSRDYEMLFEYGDYILSQSEIYNIEEIGEVSFGKSNPTFYYVPKESSAPSSQREIGDSSYSDNDSYTDNYEDNYEDSYEEEQAGDDGEDLDGETSVSGEISSDETEGDTAKFVNNVGGGVEDGEAPKEDNKKSSVDKQILDYSVKGFDKSDGIIKEMDVSFIANKFAESAVLPVKGEMYAKTSQFGIRKDPFTGETSYHSGLDIAAAGINGTEIYSVLDGVVEKSVPSAGPRSSGNYIEIDHGGFKTSYSHMISPSELKKGDEVKAGDVIGYVGTTGRSTGPHLHFEVGVDELRFDPEIFIEFIKEVK